MPSVNFFFLLNIVGPLFSKFDDVNEVYDLVLISLYDLVLFAGRDVHEGS